MWGWEGNEEENRESKGEVSKEKSMRGEEARKGVGGEIEEWVGGK